MNQKEYNGWTNYETWAAKLWLDNDEGTYHHWQNETRRIWRASHAKPNWTQAEVAAIALADVLKDYHEENTPEVPGVYADLLNAALSEVNWGEIAKALIDDAEFESDDETLAELAGV